MSGRNSSGMNRTSSRRSLGQASNALRRASFKLQTRTSLKRESSKKALVLPPEPTPEQLVWYNPDHRPFFRWWILLLACMFTLGGYVAYDSTSVIEEEIKAAFDIDATGFGLLYSVWSFPNIGVPFLAGFAIDVFGPHVTAVVALTNCLIGGGLCVAASHTTSFPLLLVGRIFLGIGVEPAYVLQDVIAATWFMQHSLATALSVESSATHMGHFIAFSACPQFVEMYDDWKASLWFAAGLVIICWLCALVYVFSDRIANKIRGHALTGHGGDDDEEGEDAGVFRAVMGFPAELWLTLICCMCFFSIVYPFQSFGTTLFSNRIDHMDEDEAKHFVSYVPLTTAIMAPLLGFTIDIQGRKAVWGIIAFVLAILSFVLLYADAEPIISILMLGTAFALVPAALYPCLAILADPSALGTAYGMVVSMQNGGLALMFVVIGALSDGDEEGTGDTQIITYGILSVVGLLCWLGALFFDSRNKCQLNAKGEGGLPSLWCNDDYVDLDERRATLK